MSKPSGGSGFYAPDDGRVKFVVVTPPEEGKTIQSAKAECDINTIVRQYDKMGVRERDLLALARESGAFEDVSQIGGFQEALAQVEFANRTFAQLPASVRSRFSNSSAEFVDFMADGSNYDEAVELGLAVPRPAEPPPVAPAPSA